MRAAVRWIRADLRARRGQALAMIAVVAGVVAALAVSATLLVSASDPWRALFAQTRGADVWLHLAPGTSASPLAGLPGVTALAGPYQTAAATSVAGTATAPVQLWAMRPARPAIGRPLLRQGRWLSWSAPSGVVLEASFAQAIRARPGDRLVLEGLDGSTVTARVSGVAASSDQGFYPDQTPGLVWVLPALLRQVEPVGGHTQEVVGVRLADPAVTGFFVQQAVTRLGSGAVQSVTTWRQVEASMARADPLLGLLLALFGLVSLGGAVLVLGYAAGSRVLVQLQDLAMLKTLGFTPRQLVAMLLAEHAALGLAGAAAGGSVAGLLTVPLLSQVTSQVAVVPPPAGWVALIAAGTEVAVLAATALPGWRAGRVWPVSAITPPAPAGRLSRLARLALLTRLPPAVVLGARAAFTRRLSAMLTIGGLALPLAMIVVGIGCWTTLDHVQRDPGEIGLAAPLTVRPDGLSAARTGALLAADGQVAGVYPRVTVTALLPGETSTITTLGMGTSARPYPFHVVAGRLYHAPGEAVASEGLLRAAHLQVGEYIRMPVGGVPVIFHIVGRIIEPEYGGQVLAYGIDTLTQAGAVPPPISDSLVLAPGVSVAAAESHLRRVSGGRLDFVAEVNPAAGLGVVRPLLAGLFVVLALIGLTSLLTAAAVGLRDQLRDTQALRAMGLTPAQILVSLVTRMSVLALAAAALGGGAGLMLSSRLINLAGEAFGIGAGLGSPPSAAATALAVAVAVTAAAAVPLLPAFRAGMSLTTAGRGY